MNNMGYLKSIEADLTDTFQLVSQGVLISAKFGLRVIKNPIACALPNIKSLAIPRINEAVNVKLQLRTNIL